VCAIINKVCGDLNAVVSFYQQQFCYFIDGTFHFYSLCYCAFFVYGRNNL